MLVPSDVMTGQPLLAISKVALILLGQLLPTRPGLKLFLFTILLGLLSLSKHSCQILLEEKLALKPWIEILETEEGESENSEKQIVHELQGKHALISKPVIKVKCSSG